MKTNLKEFDNTKLKQHFTFVIDEYLKKVNIISPLIGEASILRLDIMEIVKEMFDRKMLTKEEFDKVDVFPKIPSGSKP